MHWEPLRWLQKAYYDSQSWLVTCRWQCIESPWDDYRRLTMIHSLDLLLVGDSALRAPEMATEAYYDSQSWLVTCRWQCIESPWDDRRLLWFTVLLLVGDSALRAPDMAQSWLVTCRWQCIESPWDDYRRLTMIHSLDSLLVGDSALRAPEMATEGLLWFTVLTCYL